MELHTLNIEQFRQHSMRSGACYRNHLIVTDRVDDVELFKSPCRINAITVMVCTGGEIDCSINLKRYHITSDMILVNCPDDIIQIYHAEALEAYAVLVAPDFLGELEIDFKQRLDFYLNIRQNAACLLPHAEIVALKPYYSLLSDNIKTLRSETPEVIRGLIQAFSYTIISMIRLFQREEEEDTPSGMNRNKQLFNKFMALVKQHHAGARGVKFYADKLCLTPNYLSGVIKQYTGKTATEWVNDYVILEAKIMLKDSELSIAQIADKLHFTSQSAFGKYFKQQTGFGPRQYRNGLSADSSGQSDKSD